MVLCYNYDIGALGYTTTATAVVRSADSLDDLGSATLPRECIGYRPVAWESNSVVRMTVNILPWIREGVLYEQKCLEVNGITIKLFKDDQVTGRRRVVLDRQTSPSGKYDYVHYYYADGAKLPADHVSIIGSGDSIPLYGNLSIMCEEWPLANDIDEIAWTGDDTLLFISKFNPTLFARSIVKNRTSVPYKIKIRPERVWKVQFPVLQ